MPSRTRQWFITLILEATEATLSSTHQVLVIGYERLRSLVWATFNSVHLSHPADFDLVTDTKNYGACECVFHSEQSRSDLDFSPQIDLIICDEGHRLKSSQNKTTQMFRDFKTRRRIILSGTPIQNDLSEFHAMVGSIRCLTAFGIDWMFLRLNFATLGFLVRLEVLALSCANYL